jgi:hypothetical protein
LFIRERWPSVLVDVVQVLLCQPRELLLALEDDIVAGDEVEAPHTQLRGTMKLRGLKETCNNQ